MALSTFVVIQHISNLSDARYCAGMGADVLGFLLDPAEPGAISKPAFAEIMGWVAGVKVLGEFTRANASEINLAAAELNLDYVLLKHSLTKEELLQLERPVILQVPFKPEPEFLSFLNETKNGVAYFLIDLQDKTELSESEKEILKEAIGQFPVLLSGGITAENVQALLQELNPAGICLQGGHEIKPGLRDFDELADILEQLEREDA